jgi:hypothetical protein
MKNLICTTIAILLSGGALSEEYGKQPVFGSGLGGVSSAIPSSIVALLGRSNDWDRKIVSVQGFLRTDRHGVMLFLSSEYCERFAGQYGVMVELEKISPELSWEKLPMECKYALVEGEFFSTPAEKPNPNTVVIRQRLGILAAQYIDIE